MSETGTPQRESVFDHWIDQVVPEEIEWRELVREYPLISLGLIAAGGFYIGRTHGSRILEAVTDLASQRIETAADRLTAALPEDR